MKRLIRIKAIVTSLLLVFALLTLSGCGSSGSQTQPITIGMVAAITGNNAVGDKYAIHGVQLAIKNINDSGGINGRQLKLDIQDAGDLTSTAINGMNQLVSDNPAAIFTTNVSPMIYAISPQIKKAAVPTLIGGSANGLTNQGIPWIFRVRPNNSVVAQAAAQFAMENLKASKIGILYVNGEFGQDGFDGLKKALKAKGLEPVAVESHDPQAKDYSSQLLNIQKAGAEVIIAWTNPVNHAQILKQMKQLNIKSEYIGSPAAGIPSTLDLVTNDESNGIYVASEAIPTANEDPNVKQWVKTYKEQNKGEMPDFTAASYYDGAMMLFNTMKKVGVDPQKVRDEMLKISDYKGIAHTYAFSPNGDGAWDALIAKVMDKKLILQKVFNVK